MSRQLLGFVPEPLSISFEKLRKRSMNRTLAPVAAY